MLLSAQMAHMKLLLIIVFALKCKLELDNNNFNTETICYLK